MFSVDKELFKKFSVQFYAIGIFALLVIIASYYTGKLVATGSFYKADTIKQQDVKSLENELKSTKTHMAMLENTNRVNLQTIEQTRQTILQLEQQIYQQQKDIISYKAAISKQKVSSPLVFRDFIIQATTSPLVYRYKLILTRTDQANLLLKGTLHIAIEGTLDKKPKTLSLPDITTTDSHKKSISFAFRYLAMIPEKNQFAELILPDNFTPKAIKVTAYFADNSKPVSHVFDWSVEPLPIPDIEDNAD